MRFAIHLHPYSTFHDPADIVRTVRRAEDLGFEAVYLPEHVIFPATYGATMGGDWWDPIVLATHLAAHTERIRLHTAVIVLPQRSPIVLAKQIATLDVLSNGRFGLGIGIGWVREEFEMLGEDFATRAVRTEDFIKALRVLWTDEPATYHGRFVEFEDATFLPKPAQRPGPPIIIGGSVKHSAKRAARLGDGWMPMAASVDEFESGVGVLRAEAQLTGRDLEAFEICGRLPLWEGNPEVVEHAEMSGAHTSQMAYLHDDFDRVAAYINRMGALGVTQLRVDLPNDMDAMVSRMEQFAAEFLRRQ